MRGTKRTTNMNVRMAMMKTGTAQWMLADMLNVSETTVSRMFRYEWADYVQAAVVDLVEGNRVDGATVRKMIQTDVPASKWPNRKDGSVYPSQEKWYVERTVKQVEWLEKKREEERKYDNEEIQSKRGKYI